MQPNLVTVEKEITRGGTTFKQRFHVRPGYAGVEDLGADKDVSKRLVSEWVNAVAPKQSLPFRGAMAKAAGLDISRDVSRMAANEAKIGLDDEKSLTAKFSKYADSGAKDVKSVKAVKAMAQLSQSSYKEEQVTLYRGVGSTQAKELHAQLGAGKASLSMDNISSFTDDIKTARNFAMKGKGMVIKVTVPRSSIVLSHRAFSELSKEREVVIATRGGMALRSEDVVEDLR